MIIEVVRMRERGLSTHCKWSKEGRGGGGGGRWSREGRKTPRANALSAVPASLQCRLLILEREAVVPYQESAFDLTAKLPSLTGWRHGRSVGPAEVRQIM